MASHAPHPDDDDLQDWGDPVFHVVDGPREPMLSSDLLRDLGVSDATLDEQRAAVARWLASHEPNQLLRLSLQRDGLA